MKVSVYSLCHFEVDPFTCLTSYFVVLMELWPKRLKCSATGNLAPWLLVVDSNLAEALIKSVCKSTTGFQVLSCKRLMLDSLPELLLRIYYCGSFKPVDNKLENNIFNLFVHNRGQR